MTSLPPNPEDKFKSQEKVAGLSNAVSSGADLLAEGDVGPESKDFSPEQSSSINAVVEVITSGADKSLAQGWIIAKKRIENFRPLPWFLWRLSLSVFSKPVGKTKINEGMILGLRRLMFAAASDPVLGTGSKINSVKKAITILPADVIAAVSIVHSVCRRLNVQNNNTIWKQFLDEALVRAQIGYEMGKVATNIGPGRGLLSGFAAQIGFAILVACADKKQAAETMEKLSSGHASSVIGTTIYGCEPIQISAMLLAACGCGPDAANGIAMSGAKIAEIEQLEGSRSLWAASGYAVEELRKGKVMNISPKLCSILEIGQPELDSLNKKAIKIARAGHSWQWIE